MPEEPSDLHGRVLDTSSQHLELRFKERVQADMSWPAFVDLAYDALRLGEPIDLKCQVGEIRFARKYRGWCFIYEALEHEPTVKVITVLPKGERPTGEIKRDDAHALPRRSA